MTKNEEITRVVCRWDDTPGISPSWYCQSWIGGELIDDSQKVWFPVNVDCFLHSEDKELKGVLSEAFPNAAIVINANR
jgi:hypothetical protein